MNRISIGVAAAILLGTANIVTAQTSLPDMRVSIEGGIEARGAYIGTAVAVAKPWSVGVSQILRVREKSAPTRFDFDSLSSYAVTINYHPVKWLDFFVGPAAARVSLYQADHESGRVVHRFHDTEWVTGALTGASLRLYQRSFRFYTARAAVLVLPGQTMVRRTDARLGLGVGIAF